MRKPESVLKGAHCLVRSENARQMSDPRDAPQERWSTGHLAKDRLSVEPERAQSGLPEEHSRYAIEMKITNKRGTISDITHRMNRSLVLRSGQTAMGFRLDVWTKQ